MQITRLQSPSTGLVLSVLQGYRDTAAVNGNANYITWRGRSTEEESGASSIGNNRMRPFLRKSASIVSVVFSYIDCLSALKQVDVFMDSLLEVFCNTLSLINSALMKMLMHLYANAYLYIYTYLNLNPTHTFLYKSYIKYLHYWHSVFLSSKVPFQYRV